MPGRMVRTIAAIAVPLGAAALAYAFAPSVDAKHPASNLSGFFSSIASLLATALIAIAVLAVLPTRTMLKIRQVLGTLTVGWLAVGEVAALLGLLPNRAHELYRVCFAVAAGTTLWLLIIVVSIAVINLEQQFNTAVQQRADELLASGSTGPPARH